MVSENFRDDYEYEAMLGDRCVNRCDCCSGWEETKPDPTIFIDDSADQEKLDRAEERYLKICIEMDEGQ